MVRISDHFKVRGGLESTLSGSTSFGLKSPITVRASMNPENSGSYRHAVRTSLWRERVRKIKARRESRPLSDLLCGLITPFNPSVDGISILRFTLNAPSPLLKTQELLQRTPHHFRQRRGRSGSAALLLSLGVLGYLQSGPILESHGNCIFSSHRFIVRHCITYCQPFYACK